MAQLDAGASSYPRAGPVVIFGGAGVGVDFAFSRAACVRGGCARRAGAVYARGVFSGTTVMAFRARVWARGKDGPVGPRATAVR